jgi:F-type H+-transporting ATPase subunit a
MEGIHIALAPEVLGHFFGIPITNTLVTAWIVMAILIVFGYFLGRNPRLRPGRLQTLIEWLFEFVLKFMEDTLGSRKLALRFFPLITTIFLFILFSNWFNFFPILGSVGFYVPAETGIHGGSGHELFVPLLRPANTDLNLTLALAIIAYVVIEISGIVALGFLKYGSKFVNFRQGAIGFAMGLISGSSAMCLRGKCSSRLSWRFCPWCCQFPSWSSRRSWGWYRRRSSRS